VPITLPNLYCQPSDVYDRLGVEGVQLRLDDHSLATGQTVQATADAAQGSTSISVQPLQFPMLRGDVLEFDGGGMPLVVEAQLSATAGVGATSLSVSPLPGQVNSQAQATDAGVNLALAQRLVKACQYGTSQVKLYCCGRYDDSQLALAWSPNRWATSLASRWLATRLVRPCPQSLVDECKEALDEMKQVRVGMLAIEDIGTRTSAWPFMSNVRMDVRYDGTQLRMEPQISEGTPVLYPQYVDWDSVYLLEY